MKNLCGYDILLEKFIRHELSAEEFDSAYTEKFLSDKDPISEELFLKLDWLFAEVDAFSNDPNLFPDDYVSETQLRDSAQKILNEIRAL